jgi:hypothetical protein
MTDRKGRNRGRSKAKEGPKTERPPLTARTPKGDASRRSPDEGSERAAERGDKDFDPNVNQRPR